MAGSHEVRGSIPLGSTKESSERPPHRGRSSYLEWDLRMSHVTQVTWYNR